MGDEIARYRNEGKNPFDLFRRLPNESDPDWAARASGGRVSVEPPTPPELTAAPSGSPPASADNGLGARTADAQNPTDGEASQLDLDKVIQAGLVPKEVGTVIAGAIKEAWNIARSNVPRFIDELIRRLGQLRGLGTPEPVAPTRPGEKSPAELPTPEHDQTGPPRPTIASGASGYVERNGERYVALTNGSDVLGEITPEIAQAIGREAAPIRLPEGYHDFETDRGRGERHIEARHARDIQGEGFSDVGEFVADVVSGFERIYRADRGALFLVKPNGHEKVAVAELRSVGTGPDQYWEVVTAAPYRSDFFKNKEALWSWPGPANFPPRGGPSFDPGSQSND